MAGEKVMPQGLEDVVAGDSAICFIDGKKGRLIYRGYHIGELVFRTSYEEIVYLLWYGTLPNRTQLKEWTAKLAEEREIPPQVTQAIQQFPRDSSTMAALRTAVSLLALYDPDTHAYSEEANIRKGIRILSKIPTIIATFHKMREGKSPIPPRKDLSLSSNFLYMMFDKVPTAEAVEALEAYMVLLADHEFNASTFAARTTAGTLSDIHSAIVSAIGTLKGDLHGSANRRAMEMFLEIGSLDRVEPYLKEKLAQKKKIMGFGHRVYKTEDPRAPYLKKVALRLSETSRQDKWFAISEKVKEVVHREKGLYVNVDFYSATVLYYLGIPVDLFTPLFAMSRVGGWIAHVLEQYRDNRLIRPLSNYTGPMDLPFIPLDQRK